jgi:hypothetical protein
MRYISDAEDAALKRFWMESPGGKKRFRQILREEQLRATEEKLSWEAAIRAESDHALAQMEAQEAQEAYAAGLEAYDGVMRPTRAIS